MPRRKPRKGKGEGKGKGKTESLERGRTGLGEALQDLFRLEHINYTLHLGQDWSFSGSAKYSSHLQKLKQRYSSFFYGFHAPYIFVVLPQVSELW